MFIKKNHTSIIEGYVYFGGTRAQNNNLNNIIPYLFNRNSNKNKYFYPGPGSESTYRPTGIFMNILAGIYGNCGSHATSIAVNNAYKDIKELISHAKQEAKK